MVLLTSLWLRALPTAAAKVIRGDDRFQSTPNKKKGVKEKILTTKTNSTPSKKYFVPPIFPHHPSSQPSIAISSLAYMQVCTLYASSAALVFSILSEKQTNPKILPTFADFKYSIPNLVSYSTTSTSKFIFSLDCYLSADSCFLPSLRSYIASIIFFA